MKVKIVFIYSLIFLTQLIASCLPCTCDAPQTFNVVYESVIVRAFDTSGFNAAEVMDSVHRNAFGMSVSVNFETLSISSAPKKIQGFGFSAALACTCDDDEFNFIDPIDRLDIKVMDVLTNEEVDVSDSFVTFDYLGNETSLDKFFDTIEEEQDGFQFELMSSEKIPNSSVFIITVYLDSGLTLTKETGQINFID